MGPGFDKVHYVNCTFTLSLSIGIINFLPNQQGVLFLPSWCPCQKLSSLSYLIKLYYTHSSEISLTAGSWSGPFSSRLGILVSFTASGQPFSTVAQDSDFMAWLQSGHQAVRLFLVGVVTVSVKLRNVGLPHDPVVRNLPSNTGWDMVWFPSGRRFYKRIQQLSICHIKRSAHLTTKEPM